MNQTRETDVSSSAAQPEPARAQDLPDPVEPFILPGTPEPVFAYSAVGAASSVAYRAAARLRAALTAAGFDVDCDFPSLRGDTTTSDEPFVALGRLRAEVADSLARALLAATRA